MPTDYEAVKAGTKEAITEWLETTDGREAITAGARSAVVDWIELTALGTFAVSDGAKAALNAWLADNGEALAQTIAAARR
ncbi:hypothetical protein ACFPH6_19595 [Streptomyces xiangluensis]|uniref:Uncharacterized protein n=1 Tax=Streptomyces xiangluensis TaxID=2665720 RepID=A0ABV8YRD3_9ACTN